MGSEVDGDSIDMETLQAQIDLSMSFAQNLVSSWLDTTKFRTTSRTKGLERELYDYMKRPPRLGVGTIPEGRRNNSQEAARLKGKLSGSKRPHENDSDAAMPVKPVLDEDEGESRTEAIKNKPRPDLFDGRHKRKKRHQEGGKPSQPQDKPKSSSLPLASSLEGDRNPHNPNIVLNSNLELDQSFETLARTQEMGVNSVPTQIPLEPPTAIPSTASSVQTGKGNDKHPVAISPPRIPHFPDDENTSHSPKSSISSTAFSRNSLQAEILKRPILNLTGPLPSSGDEATAVPTPASTPKKRRKRRKKKKSVSAPDGPSIP